MKENSLRYLSVEQFGEYCGVNCQTVLRWINSGQISVKKTSWKGDYRIGIENLSRVRTERRGVDYSDNKLKIEGQLKVLIVDDEEDVIDSIEPIFLNNGFEISSSTNIYDAMILLHEVHPLILTLDLRILDLNGLEILTMINNLKLGQKIWVIIISGASEDVIQSAVDFGADFYLQKPFSQNDLDKIIKKLSAA